jgi:hypothetical protein
VATVEEIFEGGGDVFQRLADRALSQARQRSTTPSVTGEEASAQPESHLEDGEH